MYLKCKECGERLTFENISSVKDVDNSRIGAYCKEHGSELENELKQHRLVERYKGNEIYCKDEKYYPYWRCMYHFNTLEDCKKRIDDRHIAFVPKEFFGFEKL